MSSTLPKLEGEVSIPIGGWSLAVTEAGSPVTVTIPAGDYMLADLTAELLARLTASALTGSYSVSVDDDNDNSGGKITISATGISSFAVAWTSTALRDALGFAANLSGALTYQSPASSPYIWLPQVGRGPALAPNGSRGRPLTAGSVTVSPSGVSYALQGPRRWRDVLQFPAQPARWIWQQYEEPDNSSFESFYYSVIGTGRRLRFYSNRDDDANGWVTYRCLAINEFAAVVNPETADWTSSAAALYVVTPMDVLTEEIAT